jgi:hypothetical protein
MIAGASDGIACGFFLNVTTRKQSKNAEKAPWAVATRGQATWSRNRFTIEPESVIWTGHFVEKCNT